MTGAAPGGAAFFGPHSCGSVMWRVGDARSSAKFCKKKSRRQCLRLFMHLRQCTSAQLRHLQARDRALQGGLGPRLVQAVVVRGQAFFGPFLGGLSSGGVNVRGQFRGFGKHAQHVIVHVGKAAGNEDVLILAVDPIAQIADFSGPRAWRRAAAAPEFAFHPGADSHFHLGADHGFVRRHHFQLQRAHSHSLRS